MLENDQEHVRFVRTSLCGSLFRLSETGAVQKSGRSKAGTECIVCRGLPEDRSLPPSRRSILSGFVAIWLSISAQATDAAERSTDSELQKIVFKAFDKTAGKSKVRLPPSSNLFST